MRNAILFVFVALSLCGFSQTQLLPPGSSPQPDIRSRTAGLAQFRQDPSKAADVSVDEAIADAKKDGTLVVLNYTSATCGICINRISPSRDFDPKRFKVIDLLSGNDQHMSERGEWFRSEVRIGMLPYVAVIDGRGTRVDLLKSIEDSFQYKRFVEDCWRKSDYKYRNFTASNGNLVKMRVESMDDTAVKATLKDGPEREVPLLSLSHKDIDYLYKTTEHPTQYFAMRDWTSADGRSMTGRMVGLKDGKVQMFLANDRKMLLPLERLSAEDQTFARAAFADEPTE